MIFEILSGCLYLTYKIHSLNPLKIIDVFLAATAAQEAHFSLQVFVCTQVVFLSPATFGNFLQLKPSYGNIWQLLALAFWKLFATFKDFLELFGTFCSFFQLLATFGNFWQYLPTFGNFWQHLSTLVNSRQLLAALGNSWQILITFGDS